jgi:hypothetical protein
VTQPPEQPPFDQYGNPLQPVRYPAAGPPGGFPGYPGSGFPGQMRAIDHIITSMRRPQVVVVAFVIWLLAALVWPLGTLVRELAGQVDVFAFGLVMILFGLLCVMAAALWGAVRFLQGSFQARLALCGGAFVLEILAVANLVMALRGGFDGGSAAVGWVVAWARLLLPIVAVALSFGPGTRGYFAANLG